MPDPFPDTPAMSRALVEMASRMLPGDAQLRLAALVSAKTARPDADAQDQIQLAHYLLTGSGEFPTVEEMQRIEVQTMSGSWAVGGPSRPPEGSDDPAPMPDEGEGWKGRAP